MPYANANANALRETTSTKKKRTARGGSRNTEIEYGRSLHSRKGIKVNKLIYHSDESSTYVINATFFPAIPYMYAIIFCCV